MRSPEIQLFQKQTFAEVLQNITFVKNFVKFTVKDLRQSLFLKTSPTLKENSGTSAFLWNLKFFKNTSKKICFRKVSDLFREFTFIGSIIQQLFSFNIRAHFYGCFWLFIPVLQFSFLICYNSLIAKTEDKAQFQHSLSIHENYTFYTHLNFFFSLP